MANSIPLVRAGALAPVFVWLDAAGQSSARMLATRGLPPDLAERPLAPLTYHGAMLLLGDAYDLAGPDGGCRMARTAPFPAMGVIWTAISRGRTVGEVLRIVARLFPGHATHETFRIEESAEGVLVRSFLSLRLSPLQLHRRQQYTLALVHAFTGSGPGDGCRFRLAPHPELGVAHLHRWFGPDVSAHPAREATILVPKHLLDRRLGPPPSDQKPNPEVRALGGDSLSASAAIVLEGLLGDGVIDLDRLSRLTGRSRRTLQRQFEAEGTSFSALLEGVRRQRALALLSAGARVTDAASELGYASPSVLSHAVRRWTGSAPSALRRKA